MLQDLAPEKLAFFHWLYNKVNRLELNNNSGKEILWSPLFSKKRKERKLANRERDAFQPRFSQKVLQLRTIDSEILKGEAMEEKEEAEAVQGGDLVISVKNTGDLTDDRIGEILHWRDFYQGSQKKLFGTWSRHVVNRQRLIAISASLKQQQGSLPPTFWRSPRPPCWSTWRWPLSGEFLSRSTTTLGTSQQGTRQISVTMCVCVSKDLVQKSTF